MMCVFPSSHLLRVLHRLDVFSTTFMMSSTGYSLEWLHTYNEHLFFLHTHPNPPSTGIRLDDCGSQQNPSPHHPLLLNAPWWKPHMQIPSVHHPLCFLLKEVLFFLLVSYRTACLINSRKHWRGFQSEVPI